MIMAPPLRKCALTAHVTSSVGWLGAVAAFQALAIAAVTSREPEAVQGFYSSMSLIGWYVIIPLCVASLGSGVVMSLGTHWGLFRHYWVLVKFLLTVVAALILLGFTQTLSSIGELAANGTLPMGELRNLKQSPILHAGGGLFVLLATTMLAIYKPWGLTSYGRRTRHQDGAVSPGLNSTTVWKRYLLLGAIGLTLLFLVLHLIAGGPRGH